MKHTTGKERILFAGIATCALVITPSVGFASDATSVDENVNDDVVTVQNEDEPTILVVNEDEVQVVDIDDLESVVELDDVDSSIDEIDVADPEVEQESADSQDVVPEVNVDNDDTEDNDEAEEEVGGSDEPLDEQDETDFDDIVDVEVSDWSEAETTLLETDEPMDPLAFDEFEGGKYPTDPREVLPDLYDPEAEQLVIGRPQPGGQGAGEIPAGLEEFYNQEIEWTMCDWGVSIGYEESEQIPRRTRMCAWVIAPLDYDNPDGPTIALRMIKIPVAEGVEKQGSIFVNPGGPGSGAQNYAESLGIAGYFNVMTNDEYAPEWIGSPFFTHDIIGLDPRGTGSSAPAIICQNAIATEAEREGGELLTPEEDTILNEYKMSECYRMTGDDFAGLTGEMLLPHYGTIDVVRDLDMVRSVLGDEKFNYFGASYGSVIGYHYANLFGDRVGAMVLDGSENMFLRNPEVMDKFVHYAPGGEVWSRGFSQMQSSENTFRSFLEWCLTPGSTEAGTCFFDDPHDPVVGRPTPEQIDKAYARYQEIARAAWGGDYYMASESFHSLDHKRAVSFNDITTGTVNALYSVDLWDQLNQGLINMQSERDATLVMQLSDWYSGRFIGPDGLPEYSGSNDRFQVITCIDNGEVPDGAFTLEEIYATAPFRDPGFNEDGTWRVQGGATSFCHFMNEKGTLPTVGELLNLPNVLIVSSTNDHATPYWQGVVTADALNGTLLTVASSTHVQFGKSQCATALTNAFFNDPAWFLEQMNSGGFNSALYTGATDVMTKNIHSESVVGQECSLFKFENEPEVTPEPADDESTGGTTQPDDGEPGRGEETHDQVVEPQPGEGSEVENGRGDTVEPISGDDEIRTGQLPGSDKVSSVDQAQSAGADRDSLAQTGATSVSGLVGASLLILLGSIILAVRQRSI